MGFLGRLRGKQKADPMAEVSATAVAHLREQNLKFQKFMRDKVQELEEKVALEQQRLSPETEAIPYDFERDFDPVATDPQGSEDVTRPLSLEDSVPLTGAVITESEPALPENQQVVTVEPAPASPPVEEMAAEPVTEEPVLEPPPSWESLLGVEPAAPERDETNSMEGPDEPWEEPAAEAVELEPAAEEIEETEEPWAEPTAWPEVEETAETTDEASVSLLQDWGSFGIVEPDMTSEQKEPEKEVNEEEIEEGFILLEDEEDEEAAEIPLPDELGDWS